MRIAETLTDILTRAISTGVLTNSDIFIFLCFFQFGMFCRKHYKIGVSALQNKKKHKQYRNCRV